MSNNNDTAANTSANTGAIPATFTTPVSASGANATSQASTTALIDPKHPRGPGAARQPSPFATAMQVPSGLTDAAKSVLEQLPFLVKQRYQNQDSFHSWIKKVVEYCSKAKVPLPFEYFWVHPINPALGCHEAPLEEFPVVSQYFLKVIFVDRFRILTADAECHM
ncbi:hypothetical protein DFS34DRAFT_590460 [Phlyctochytrium arcticum]|nr:hypothetical protein DFS34DRAFT_598306 [Phlyctochytrium arcticum]KAI9104039.1 hypothetical protein DFS34DRAFT_590460 [Phlyctochytrium arcticum]